MNRSYSRTLEDVSRTLVQAKHKDDEVKTISQIFYYPTLEEANYGQDEIKLLDVDEEFISLFEEGKSVVFKGDDMEKVVLCTENHTYEVKEGEISNSFVLVPELLYSSDISAGTERQIIEKKIVGIYHNYLELRETYPRINKLRNLLNNCAYKGPEHEVNIENTGYYRHELLNLIQASEGEIDDSLKDMMAFCLDGKWRAMDVDYESRILSHVVSLMHEQSWSCIVIDETISLLSELAPDYVLRHVLSNYMRLDHVDENKCHLREDRVSRCFAEMLLRASEGKFRYSEFMMAWKQCLPEGLEPDLQHLNGLALIEEESLKQKIICLYPESNLPENIPERFRLLFKRKEKWSLNEIEPYIRRLTTKNMNVNTMLTKYSRQSKLDGLRVYGARHAK